MCDVLKEALSEFVEEEIIRFVNNSENIIETSEEYDTFIDKLIRDSARVLV